MEDMNVVVEDILKNKKVETPEIKDDEKKLIKSNKKKYNGDLRGFKTYEDAIDYPKTEAFSNLDIGCQTEYKNWLKNIM